MYGTVLQCSTQCICYALCIRYEGDLPCTYVTNMVCVMWTLVFSGKIFPIHHITHMCSGFWTPHENFKFNTNGKFEFSPRHTSFLFSLCSVLIRQTSIPIFHDVVTIYIWSFSNALNEQRNFTEFVFLVMVRLHSSLNHWLTGSVSIEIMYAVWYCGKKLIEWETI